MQIISVRRFRGFSSLFPPSRPDYSLVCASHAQKSYLGDLPKGYCISIFTNRLSGNMMFTTSSSGLHSLQGLKMSCMESTKCAALEKHQRNKVQFVYWHRLACALPLTLGTFFIFLEAIAELLSYRVCKYIRAC